MKPIRRPAAAVAVVITATAGLLVGSGILTGAASAATTFIGPLNTETVVASTVPASGPEAGDVNPYGVAVVQRSTGNLTAGNVLVSNFNNAANAQGTGSTIVQVTPGGHQSVFATVPHLGGACPGRHRPDHRAGRAAHGLGDRRLAAHPERHDLRTRLPDRAGQPRRGPGDDHRPRHRRAVGHDRRGGGNLFGLAVKPGADAVYFVDDFGSDNNLQLFY